MGGVPVFKVSRAGDGVQGRSDGLQFAFALPSKRNEDANESRTNE
jgi:hypothetical protein